MKILMLEDNGDRIAAFQSAISGLPDYEMVIWRNAPDMISQIAGHLSAASLISLDHDLVQDPGDPDPGDGLQVAKALAKHEPVCAVVLHSTNRDRVYSMIRELEDGGWTTLRVGPVGMGEDWIPSVWLPKVKDLLAIQTDGRTTERYGVPPPVSGGVGHGNILPCDAVCSTVSS